MKAVAILAALGATASAQTVRVGPGMYRPIFPTSPAEREIAVLAAEGQSSKDIAAKLFISLRTVDNHLQRIYSKLGVTGRDQLKELLG